MSIDIASSSADLPTGTTLLEALRPDSDAVYAFDFDGVISSSLEDDIYHLPTWGGEETMLSGVATRLDIKCEGMETKYQRHLLFQACAHFAGISIERGVGFDLLKEVSRHGRVFVVTARSGWFAVERMRDFLKEHSVVPVDVFNVGRVAKERQLALLCNEFKNREVYFIEDNVAHLAAARHLAYQNLSLVWAPRNVPKPPQEILQRIVSETLDAGIKAAGCSPIG